MIKNIKNMILNRYFDHNYALFIDIVGIFEIS